MKHIISFDLDGTLVKPGFGDAVWLEGLPAAYAQENHISIQKAQQFFKQTYDAIGSERREWYDLSYWINTYNLPIAPMDLLNKYENNITLYEDVKPTLQHLSKEFPLIISSGAMTEFIEKELQYTGIHHFFSYIFSSTSDTNTVKKDPEFYKMIAKKIGCTPSSIIHIGDHRDYDYTSAKKAGCHAFYLNRDRSTPTSYSISTLHEFEIHIHKNFKITN